MKLIHLNGQRIVVARTEEAFVAVDDLCTHKGGVACRRYDDMRNGAMSMAWISVDVRTGEVKAGPAQEKIRTYKIKLVNDTLYLDVNS